MQYVVTSSRAGVGAAADVVPVWAGAAGLDCRADTVVEITAISAIAPPVLISVSCCCRVRITLLRSTPVLRLARTAELRIRAVLEQKGGPFRVEADAPDAVAEAGGSQIRRHTTLVDDVHVRAFVD